MKKRGLNKRRVIINWINYHDGRRRTDPRFYLLFTEFLQEMKAINQKKGFNKKDFSRIFRRFDDVVGIYPFPNKLVTRYLKEN